MTGFAEDALSAHPGSGHRTDRGLDEGACGPPSGSSPEAGLFARALAGAPARRAGVLAVLAFFALALWAGDARAQSLLVGNIGQATSTTVTIASPNGYEQAFTTGANSGGYTVSLVRFRLRGAGSGTNTPRVSIRNAGGTELFVLTNRLMNYAMSSFTFHEFDAPTGSSLDANTTYYVVVSVTAGSFEFSRTTSTGLSADSAAGWAIGDANSLVGMTSTADTNRLKLAIAGSEKGAGPSVDSIAFNSAGTDGAFKTGDAVTATVTFSESVTVDTTDGTPQLTIKMGGADKVLAYSSGSPGTALVFSGYTVAASDEDTDGLSVEANKLDANGGTIKSTADANVDADLTHAAVAASANHKVDGVKPTLVTTGDDAPKTSVDGSKIILVFSENIGSVDTSKITVKVGTTDQTISSGSRSGTEVELTLSTALSATATNITVTLDAEAVTDVPGNGIAAVSATSVTRTLPPGKPTLTLAAKDASIDATVVFTGHGTSDITKYQYQIKSGSDAFGSWTDSTDNVSNTGGTFTIGGLTNGTEYTVQVRGVNSDGEGAASDAKAATPDAPPAVSSVAITSTPATASTYIIGEEIEFTVTFDKNLTIAGTNTSRAPGFLTFRTDYHEANPSLDPPEASCAIGTDTKTLVCTDQVEAGWYDNNGIAVGQNGLQPGLQAHVVGPLGQRANYDHSVVAADSDHKIDGIRPTLTNTAVSSDRTKIILTFSELIRDAVTAKFTVKKGGTDQPTTGVPLIDIDTNRTVTLTMTTAFAATDTGITIDLAADAVKDVPGNGIAEDLARTVTIEDNTPPTLSSAGTYAIGGTGTGIALQFNETIASTSIPGTSAFAAKIGTTSVTVTSVAHDSTNTDTVNLVLGANPKQGDAVTVSYTLPGSNPLEDGAGNDVASFTDESVTNNNTAPGLPTVTLAPKDKSIEVTVAFAAGDHGTHNITKYQYRTKTTGNFGSWTDSTTDVSNTGGTFTITGLTNGTAYAVQVRGVSAAGDGDLSDEKSGTPDAPPAVSSVAITSNPGTDKTYAIGESIVVTFTFDKNITLRGAAYIILDVGTSEKEADCTVGTPPTKDLVCTHTVVEGELDDNGVSVQSDVSHLRRQFVGPLGQPADTTHSGLAADSDHKIDGIRPTLSRADADPNDLTKVILTFSEAIGTVTQADITVKKGTTDQTITAASIDSTDATKVVVTLSAALLTTDTNVTVDLAADAVKDVPGNGIAEVVGTSVSVEDNTAPTFVSAGTSGADKVVLTYDEPLNTTQPATSAFTVKVGGTGRDVSTVAIAGSAVTLTLASAFRPGDTLTVSYTKPGTNPIKDAADNEAVSLAETTVTNNLAATAPDAPGSLAAGTVNISTAPVRPAADVFELSWTIPWHNGSAIEKHQYRYAEGSSVPPSTTWVDIPTSAPGEPNDTDFNVSGLDADTEYTFEVRAVNGIDPGPEASVTRRTLAPAWSFTLRDSSNNNVTQLTEGGDPATATVSITNDSRFSTAQTVDLKWGTLDLSAGLVVGAGGVSTITIPAEGASGTLEISSPENSVDNYDPPTTLALTATHAGTEIDSIQLTRRDDENPPVATISMAPTSVNEGEDIEVQITLSPPFGTASGSQRTVIIDVMDDDGVLSGPLPTNARFGFNEGSQTITLTAAENTTQDDGAHDVTFALQLNPDSPYTLGTAPAVTSVTITVRDDDTPPLAPRNFTAQAGNTEAILSWDAPLASTPDHGQPVLRYEYRVKVGTGSFSAWAPIPGGDKDTRSHTFTGLTNDELHTYELAAVNVAERGAVVQETVTPIEGVAVSFGAASLSVDENDSVTVTVTLATAPAVGETVTVPIVATPGTGLASTEYSGVPPSVTFGASETSKSFTVSAENDTDDEPDRLLTLGFGPLPAGYVPGTNSQLVLTLVDDDVPIVSATFDAATAQVQEGTSRQVTVSLSQAPEREVVLSIRASRGANLAADEVSGVPESVTFAADETGKSFTVAIADDTVEEGNETLTLTFGAFADNRVTQGANTQLVLTVTDDDGPPLAPDVSVQTGDGFAVLSWPAVQNDSPVLRYEVRWRESDGGAFNTRQQVGLVTSYRVEGLDNDKAYEFQVRGVNAHGNGEEASASGTPTERLTGIPKAVQGLWVRATDSGRAELSWGQPANATDEVFTHPNSGMSEIQGYRIEVCRTACGDEANWYALVANTGKFEHTYTHQVLAPGVIRENRYRVRAININGKTGPWSKVATLAPTELGDVFLQTPNDSTLWVRLKVRNPDGNALHVRYENTGPVDADDGNTGTGTVGYAEHRLTKKGDVTLVLTGLDAGSWYRVDLDFVNTFDSERLQTHWYGTAREGETPLTSSAYALDLLDAQVYQGGSWRDAADTALRVPMGETGKYRVRLKSCSGARTVVVSRTEAPAGALGASPMDANPALLRENCADGGPGAWREVSVAARGLAGYGADRRADALLRAPFAVVYKHQVWRPRTTTQLILLSKGVAPVRILVDRPADAVLPVPDSVTIGSNRVMSWDAVPGATGYLVVWRHGPHYSDRANENRNLQTATSITLPPGASGRGPVTARVRAYSTSGVSAWSDEQTWDSRQPTLNVADTAVNEDDGSVGFLVTLAPASTGTVTVQYATQDGTAVAPADYTSTSGTLTFAPGQTEKQTALVPIVDDDEEDSGETFTLVLSNPAGSDANNGAAVIGDGEAVATILNSEQAPAPLTGFTLVDAATNDDLMLLAEGSTVRLGDLLASSYGIRAEMGPGAAPGSVRLELSGAKTAANTDDASPWSLYGDGAGRINGAALPPGSYTLTATAYANSGGQGEERGSLSVSFTVAAGALGVTTPGPFTVAEGETAVATLAASETGTGEAASWSIPAGAAGGADRAAFALTAEGVLSLAAAKDFEAPDDADGDGTYEVTVEVTVGAQTATAALSVTLSDVDEPALVVTTAGPFTVAEGETAVATLAASDTGTGATPSWSIPAGTAGGADGAAFTITAEGVLSLVAARDFEAPGDADGDGTYEVTVSVAAPATLMAGAQTATAALLVTLADVNEAPAAKATAATGVVREGAQVTLDGSASTDPDADDTLNYSWTQVQDGAPRVALSDASAAKPVFTSPSGLTAETGLAFTLKVTDAAGLHSEDTVTVTVTLLSELSITAAADYAAEGAEAVFRVTRAGSARAALTVPVTVEETGSMLGADVPTNATLAAGVRETELRVPTAADTVSENDSLVTVRLGSGSGWQLADGAATASLRVLDDDAAPVVAVSASDVTVWSADMTVVEYSSRSIGAGTADLFSNQQGRAGLRATRLWYDPTERKLRIGFDDGLDDAESLTLHMGAVSVGFPANSGGDSSFTLENVDVSWTDGETLTVRVSKPSTQAVSTDATLASLSVDGASLSPAFDAGVLVYRAVVDAGVETVTVKAKAADGGAAVAYGPEADADEALADHQVAAPVGESLIEVTVTAADGTLRRYRVVLARAAGVANTAPAGLPAISGTAQVGETLTASAAAITDADGIGNAVFAWQWISNDGATETAVADATESTYTVAPADAGKTLTVRVTFTDDKGAEEVLTSAATETVAARAPDAPGGLAAATAEGREGELTVSWTAPASDGGSEVTGYRVQWKSGTEAYDGSEASARQALVNDPAILSHTVTGLTVGTAYTVRVLAVNAAGAGAAAEAEATVRDRVVPALASASVDGTILTLTYNEALDTASQPAAGAFAVTVDGTARTVDAVSLSGSAVVLTLASAVAEGETVTVGYTAPTGAGATPLKDAAGNAAASFTDEAVTNETEATNTAPTGLPAISGTPEVGEVLTASVEGITDADGTDNATFAYQWLAHDGNADTAIEGATGATYEVAPAQAGKTLKVRVTFTDDEGTEEVLTSAATETVVDRRPVAAALSVGAGAAEAGRFRLRIAFGDAVTGLALTDLAAARVGGDTATVSELAETETGRVWTAWVAADAGRYTVRLAAGAAQAGSRQSLAAVLAVDVDAQGNAVAVAGPVVTSVALAPAGDGAWTEGDTVRLRLGFSEHVTVATGGGTPAVGIALDGAAREASYASGSGTATLAFAYEVTADDGTVSSVSLTADSLALNGGAIRDSGGRDADLDHPGIGEAAEETNTESASVLSGLKLVDTGTGTEAVLADSDTLLLEDPANGSWGLVATVSSEAQAGSVVLSLTGAKTVTVTDDAAPYSLYGDSDGTVTGGGLPAGSYTLTATAYAEAGGSGAALGTLSVSFTVSASEAADPDALTASFTGMPSEHGGGGEANQFSFDLSFSENVKTGWRKLKERAFLVSGGHIEKVRRKARFDGTKNQHWTIFVEPTGFGDVTVTLPGGRACGAANAICTWDAPARPISNTATATVAGPAALSVADATANENTDTGLEFAVTLDRASTLTVTVAYATSDGTATAGQDYTATSGTLTFSPGDTAKTVIVPVLNDAHDDGGETMTLTLSNASNARIADGTATGTITNSDPIPQAWLARFGRTVGDHVVEAVGARIEGRSEPGSRLTLGGRQVLMDAAWPAEDGALPASWTKAGGIPSAGVPPSSNGIDSGGPLTQGREGNDSPAQEVSMGEFLLASSFHLASADGEDKGASGRWSMWGRGARSSFSGKDGDLTLDGDVTTGLVGADYESGRLLAGVALALSAGSGNYTATAARGELESTLTSVHPYLRYTVSERLTLWAVLGLGEGELKVDMEDTAERRETDLSMGMAALGVRGALVSWAGLDLAIKSDVLLVRTESDAVEGLAAAEAETRRLRLALEGSREMTFAGGVLRPSLEIGLRYDGGDAETGSGIELGGALRYAGAGGLAVEVRTRGLIAHEEADYEEWGVSATVVFSPGEGGRGLSVRAGSAWGAASGGAERLWSQRTAAGLAREGDFEPGAASFEAEVGYGVDYLGGLLTPYTGLTVSGSDETYRAGGRFRLAESLTMSLEGEHRERDAGDPVQGVALKGTMRW